MACVVAGPSGIAPRAVNVRESGARHLVTAQPDRPSHSQRIVLRPVMIEDEKRNERRTDAVGAGAVDEHAAISPRAEHRPRGDRNRRGLATGVGDGMAMLGIMALLGKPQLGTAIGPDINIVEYVKSKVLGVKSAAADDGSAPTKQA